MWTRKELKTNAKATLKGNYWTAFLAILIYGVIVVLLSGGVQSMMIARNVIDTAVTASSPEDMMAAMLNAYAAASGTSIISLILSIFVISPLTVGLASFFLKAAASENSVGNLWNGFKGNYKNVVWTLFKRDLFVFLWSLLFIIPGIIKTFQYAMVEFILAENPDISSKEALLMSRKMMKGNKWRFFVLGLSFIGWFILGSIVFGVGQVFVLPYYLSTIAQFYNAVKVPNAE